MTESRNQRRRVTRPAGPASTTSSGVGEPGVQIGADGPEPSIGLGGGVHISSSGDLGVGSGPVNVDVSSSSSSD